MGKIPDSDADKDLSSDDASKKTAPSEKDTSTDDSNSSGTDNSEHEV